jgi:HSP20 family molecular chaperone IbpA
MNALEKWNPLRGSSVWDPIRQMQEMQSRVASLFGQRMALKKDGGEEGFMLTEWIPPVDIAEDDKEYTIKVELPGVNKEDVRVSVEGGVLSISGERKAEKEETNKKYHRIMMDLLSTTLSATMKNITRQTARGIATVKITTIPGTVVSRDRRRTRPPTAKLSRHARPEPGCSDALRR